MNSNFAQCRHYTNFKWPYFRTAGGHYGHMVGHAASPICIAHTNVTFTSSKVKVIPDLLKFRKLHFPTSTSYAIFWWRSRLMGDYDSMRHSHNFSEPYFWISAPLGGHVASNFAKCWYHQKRLKTEYIHTPLNDFVSILLCVRRISFLAYFIDRDTSFLFFHHFVIAHVLKWRYFHFRSEICCHC